MADMGKEKKARKVVSNDVSVSSGKRVKDAFIQKDGKTIRDYAFFDVFIPSVKRTIYDLITRIFGMALFGDKGVNSSGYSGGGVDYARPYQQVAYNNSGSLYGSTGRPVQNNTPIMQSGFEYENWVFSNRGDAEAVLNQLTDIIETYGVATIMDLYDSVGKTAPYTADNFGWKSINGCEPRLCSGGWRLAMTRPSPIK